MSKAPEVNPPVRLESRPGDIELTPDELRGLAFFAMIRKSTRMPKFEELPGATRLRRYQDGDVVWRQGEVGFTAFYILTAADLARVRQSREAMLQSRQARLGAADLAPDEAARLGEEVRQL